MRKRLILLLPGKIQQTNRWKKMLFTTTDKGFFFFFLVFFEIAAEVLNDKRC